MSKKQLHLRMSDDQIKLILDRYQAGILKAKRAREYLGLSKSRFYEMVTKYIEAGVDFTVQYRRLGVSHCLAPEIKNNILHELKIEKEKIIDNHDTPTNRYNYSYIRNLIEDKYQQKVSVPTIITYAKEHGYWKNKSPQKEHNREVISNYVGELIQHDSSHHAFAPDAQQKWYLITSLDDYSRLLVFADLFLHESSWNHIFAVESVCTNYGFPYSYYADQHSIFRYVKDRDKNSPWNTYTKFTDDVSPQWKQVLLDCGITPIYALSPQAKGKIERPYRWLQDHLVRTCLRSNVTSLPEARKILQQEVYNYNYKHVHSATGQIPAIRFKQAIDQQNSMFRPFHIRKPYQSSKDLFCLRIKRIVDSYGNIHVQNIKIKIPSSPFREEIELRLYPNTNTELVEVRFWHHSSFLGSQIFKLADFPIVRF